MSQANARLQNHADMQVGALIRARRRHMALTLQELCDRAGISVGHLSQIERDRATPSLGTLAQIAHGLNVGLDYFIATPSMEDSVTRATDRTRFSVDGSSIVYERIAADFAGNVLSSFVMHLPPGYRSETVSHEGEEIIFVLDGEIIHTVDGVSLTLGPGDSMHFRSHRPHSWANRTAQAACQLCVSTLPIFTPRRDEVQAPARSREQTEKLTGERKL